MTSITKLPAATELAATNLFGTVRDPDGVKVSEKVTLQLLLAFLQANLDFAESGAGSDVGGSVMTVTSHPVGGVSFSFEATRRTTVELNWSWLEQTDAQVVATIQRTGLPNVVISDYANQAFDQGVFASFRLNPGQTLQADLTYSAGSAQFLAAITYEE